MPTNETINRVEVERQCQEAFAVANELALRIQDAHEQLFQLEHHASRLQSTATENAANHSRLKQSLVRLQEILPTVTESSTEIADPFSDIRYAQFSFDGTLILEDGLDPKYVRNLTARSELGGHYDPNQMKFVNLNPAEANILIRAIKKEIESQSALIKTFETDLPRLEAEQAATTGQISALSGEIESLSAELSTAVTSMNSYESQIIPAGGTLFQHINVRCHLYSNVYKESPRGVRLIKDIDCLTDNNTDLYREMLYKTSHTLLNQLFTYGEYYYRDLLLIRPLEGSLNFIRDKKVLATLDPLCHFSRKN